MVDVERVRRLLGALASYREQLEGLRSLPREAYLAEQPLAGRYLVQVCAQTCIDVASHVTASEGWRVPADFRDAFTVLEEHGVLEADLAERMRSLAGLRNRLVHVYDDIDDGLVYAALEEGIADLHRFASSVAALADEQA